jgi:hypothetical protein
VVLRAGLNVLEERKTIFLPTGIRTPDGPASSIAAMPHTLFRLHYYYYCYYYYSYPRPNPSTSLLYTSESEKIKAQNEGYY